MKIINKSDVTFEGKWKFTPNKHEVIQKLVSKDPNKELPYVKIQTKNFLKK